jgi:Serine dehydrogenase proteinase
MPTWGDILNEINQTAQLLQASGSVASPHDLVRRKYLGRAASTTGRPTILYATAWIAQPNAPPALTSVTDEDMHALMEAVHGIAGPNLDLILHSPGGSAGAAEAIVKYLRSKFDHIRIIVPHMAMSAATMISCAANEIVLARHSFLGPIDPQLLIQTGLGPRYVPAQAILDQFQRALQDAADPVKLRVWAPMLNQYGPDLLVTCQNLVSLSEQLVSQWLEDYMFSGQANGKTLAKTIASWLSAHNTFLTHARPIPRDQLAAQGLVISHLEANQSEQDASLSVYHAAAHTFVGTPCVKIVENHLGKAFMKMNFSGPQIQFIPPPPIPMTPPPAPLPPLPAPPATPPEAALQASPPAAPEKTAEKRRKSSAQSKTRRRSG